MLAVEHTPGMTCARTFAEGASLLVALRDTPAAEHPHVLLLDVTLPGGSSMACVEQVRARMPQRPVVLLTNDDDDDHLLPLLRAGASGYLLKRLAIDPLLAGIREAAAGGRVLPRAMTRRVDPYCSSPASAGQKKSWGEVSRENP